MKKLYLAITRGDTMILERYFTDKNGTKLEFDPSKDQINFTVRKDMDSPVVIEKHLSDMKCVDKLYTITVLPTDTQNLDFGVYGYDIEIRIGTEFVLTVESGNLELLKYDYSRPKEN